MKKYIVGYLSLFENELKLLTIDADSAYDAVKKAMVESCSEQEYKESELKWQESNDYPKDLEKLVDMLFNSDMVVNVKEI